VVSTPVQPCCTAGRTTVPVSWRSQRQPACTRFASMAGVARTGLWNVICTRVARSMMTSSRPSSILFFFLLFENFVQLELQSTALEVGVAMTPEHKVDVQVVLSLARSSMLCTSCTPRAAGCGVRPGHVALHPLKTGMQRPRHATRGRRSGSFRLQSLSSFFWCLCMAHTLAKTIIPSCVCNCGWNVPFDFTSGCVGEFRAGTCF